jgi:hypothetical protein
MSELIAIKFEDDWADEFYAEGIQIMELEQWENHKREAREKFGKKPRVKYFGTNEFFEFHDVDDYLSKFTELDLSQEEILTLKKAIGSDFGIFSLIEEFDED